jgi:hypothetical protein
VPASKNGSLHSSVIAHPCLKQTREHIAAIVSMLWYVVLLLLALLLSPEQVHGDDTTLTLTGSSEPVACQHGFYCPSGASTTRTFPCGSAAVYCPANSQAPVAVSTGFYTATVEEPCGPGQFRNWTAYGESYHTEYHPWKQFPATLCELCPAGTYKATTGDDVTLCLACPPMTASDTALRQTCFCRYS